MAGMPHLASQGQHDQVYDENGALGTALPSVQAPFAHSLGEFAGQPNFPQHPGFYPSPGQPYYGVHDAMVPGHAQVFPSAIPILPAWQDESCVWQTAPQSAACQGFEATTPATLWPTHSGFAAPESEAFFQNVATEFYPAMSWGKVHIMTQDKIPAPHHEVFYLATRDLFPSWLGEPPRGQKRFRNHQVVKQGENAIRYWTEEAYKNPRAKSLAKRHAIRIPRNTDQGFRSNPLYPMRRLVLKGEDTPQNLALFFGPTWCQDTLYYHWVSRMAIFFPPATGTWHKWTQSVVDEFLGENQWKPKMPYKIETAIIGRFTDQHGLERILHRMRRLYGKQYYYSKWPYCPREFAASLELQRGEGGPGYATEQELNKPIVTANPASGEELMRMKMLAGAKGAKAELKRLTLAPQSESSGSPASVPDLTSGLTSPRLSAVAPEHRNPDQQDEKTSKGT